jgi:hypothetical protein
MTIEDAEKIVKEFFSNRDYKEIEIHSCELRQPDGYKVMATGKIIKSGKSRYDGLEADIDGKGKVVSYKIDPGMEAFTD